MKGYWLLYLYSNIIPQKYHIYMHTHLQKPHELSYKTDYKHRKKDYTTGRTSNSWKCGPSFESKKKTTCLSELPLSTGEC